MTSKALGLVTAILAGLVAGSPAWAREPFDDVFFVKHGGDAEVMFQDRSDCSREAVSIGGTAAAFSDPNYGALSAMGESLDSDALHEGGLHKRLVRAVFLDCMKRRGWSPLDPDRDEIKQVARASPRHPEVLDLWLKAHEPPLPPPASVPAPGSTAATAAAPAH